MCWLVLICWIFVGVSHTWSRWRCVSTMSRMKYVSGYFSRTSFRCSHVVVKTLLYCTRKCGCKGGCVSTSCFLQPPRTGSTGQVPVLEHETFSRKIEKVRRAAVTWKYGYSDPFFVPKNYTIMVWRHPLPVGNSWGLRYWNEAEINFLRPFRQDYLDYLKNEAKSGDMTVLENRSPCSKSSHRESHLATSVRVVPSQHIPRT